MLCGDLIIWVYVIVYCQTSLILNIVAFLMFILLILNSEKTKSEYQVHDLHLLG